MCTHLEPITDPLLRGAAAKNLDHPVVDLHGDDPPGGLEEPEGEVAGAGSDFEDGVTGENTGLADDSVQGAGVGEDVLAPALVEADVPALLPRRRRSIFFFVFARLPPPMLLLPAVSVGAGGEGAEGAPLRGEDVFK